MKFVAFYLQLSDANVVTPVISPTNVCGQICPILWQSFFLCKIWWYLQQASVARFALFHGSPFSSVKSGGISNKRVWPYSPPFYGSPIDCRIWWYLQQASVARFAPILWQSYWLLYLVISPTKECGQIRPHLMSVLLTLYDLTTTRGNLEYS